MTVHLHDGTSTPAFFIWLNTLLGIAAGAVNLIVHRGRLGALALAVGASSTGLGMLAAYQQASAATARH